MECFERVKWTYAVVIHAGLTIVAPVLSTKAQ